MTSPSTPVDLIPITSQTKTVQDCFRQCLYEVPNFQRPYSWTETQLLDYWNDVVLAKGDFFFGSTVTWVSAERDLFNNSYSIIDGQQRLTTSAIALSVIRDAFTQISVSDSDAAKQQERSTQKYLIIEDDDGKPYPVLKRPESMFYEHIQSPDAIPSGATWNSSAARIGEARKFFEEKTLDELVELSIEGKVERLKTLRANVLKARVIQVELKTQEDGFLIFETLNTRGSDLRLSDLIKNLLIRGGAATSANRDAIATRWDRLCSQVEYGHTSPDSVDRFIWQSWNSRRDAVKEPELFKRVSKLVAGDPKAHIAYLEELEEDATLYAKLDDEAVQLMPKKGRSRHALSVAEFVDSLRALAILNVSVANSAILAVARKYEHGHLVSQSQLVHVSRMIETFHFQFTALVNSGSTGGTRARYNRFAVRLENSSTKKEVAEAVADLQARLKASLPPRSSTVKAFCNLFYAPKLKLTEAQKPRARRIFITFILMGLAKYNKLVPAGQDLTTWSVEHLKPQSHGSTDLADTVYSIGNLALLAPALNGQLGSLSISGKIAVLKNSNVFLDQEIQSWAAGEQDEAPTDEQIRDRANHLAAEAIDKVWTL